MRNRTLLGGVAVVATTSSLFFSPSLATAQPAAKPAAPARRAPAAGQPAGAPVRLSIEDAIARAIPASEPVASARAGYESARYQIDAAWSGLLPQVDLNASYTRTLKTEFAGVFTDLPMEGTQSLPFGQADTWRAGMTIVQSIYDGGRTRASVALARSGAAISRLGVDSTQTQAVFAVAQSYYDAVLAVRQVEIAEQTLEQAEESLQQTIISNQQGVLPEFDVLRAEVARDNQRTLLIQFRAERDVAFIRLKRLVGVAPPTSLELTSPLELPATTAPAAAAPAASEGAVLPEAATAGAEQVGQVALGTAGIKAGAVRTVIVQAEELVRSRRARLGIAKADLLPQIAATSDLGFVNYPQGGFLPDSDWRTNWTVGIGVTFPLFDGFRRRSQVRSARADIVAAEADLANTIEQAEVEAAEVDALIDAAEATWISAARTAAQAQRAYEIAEVRYQQGASTQLELNDARLQLRQSQLSHARAARDLRVARLRRDLLPGLPLGVTAGSAVLGVQGTGAPTGPATGANIGAAATATATGSTATTGAGPTGVTGVTGSFQE